MAANLFQLERPARYLGGEAGSTQKDWSQVDLTIALAFPDVYEVGMSHIGSAILYRTLNDQPWIAAERAYAPWPDREEQLRSEGQPLASLENQQPLAAFDIVGFSLQYELCYSNVLNMLNLAGLPLRAAARDGSHPLVIAGGPCAFNPEPLADFLDCVLIGDAEESLPELCDAVRTGKRLGESRQALLQRLSQIEGVYVPSQFEVSYRDNGEIKTISPIGTQAKTVRRRVLADLDSAPYPSTPVVPFLQTIHDRVAIEVTRGCTRGCRFCQAGYIYRPVRERQPETIRTLIDQALQQSGYDEVSLLSLSTGDYTAIEMLMQNLMGCFADQKVAVSLPSLRVGSLTPELMAEIKKVRKTGFTLAPEAGSERLRQVINKGISEADLLDSAQTAFELGWRLIKLYFMLGLPTETEDDLDALIELAGRVKARGRGTEGGADVNASVSTFVPKAHTPFQWEPQISYDETLKRQGYLRAGLKRKKVRFKWHDAELSFLEGVFARGDRRLGAVLEEAVRLGCRFDGWRDHFNWELWQQTFANTGVDAQWYLRARKTGETLPWDHLDAGVSKDFLLREKQAALLQRATPDCRNGQCGYCGLCDFETVRPRLARTDRPIMAESGGMTYSTEPSPLPKLRLTLTKTGRVANLSHLEYMTLIQRAVRRAGLPVRYSGGFHPAPRISFGDALPLGVASEAELVDLELSEPCTPEKACEQLNRELPEGVRVLHGELWPRKGPAPGKSLTSATYRVPLPDDLDRQALELRITQSLGAETLPVQRQKKNRTLEVDLRPWIVDLRLDTDALWLEMATGSPLVLASHLLDLDPETVRCLGLCKTAVTLNDHCETDECG